MQEWMDVPLDVDDDALAERWEGTIVADEPLRLLARENRLSLWRSDPERADLGDGTAALDVNLNCIAHAHPQCRFRWVRLTVDFTPTPGAQIADMSPRDEISTVPVKVTTTRSTKLSFDIKAVPITPEAGFERTREQDVFLPKVTASGLHLSYATWDFTAVGDEPLHVDRTLRLLLSLPTAAATVPVTVTLRGRVAAEGFAGSIPLLGRRTDEFVIRDDLH